MAMQRIRKVDIPALEGAIPWWSGQTWGQRTLLEVMLDKINRTPQSAADIFRDTLADYGSCAHERYLWRSLALLCALKLVAKEVDWLRTRDQRHPIHAYTRVYR
jgi:hypothetical protein